MKKYRATANSILSLLFIIVIISIFVTAWIGIKFFYFVPQKACGSVLIEVLWHSARKAWACIGGGKKRWQGVCGFASWIGRQRLIGIVLVVALTSVSATLAMSRRYWLDRPNAQEIRFTSNAHMADGDVVAAGGKEVPSIGPHRDVVAARRVIDQRTKTGGRVVAAS